MIILLFHFLLLLASSLLDLDRAAVDLDLLLLDLDRAVDVAHKEVARAETHSAEHQEKRVAREAVVAKEERGLHEAAHAAAREVVVDAVAKDKERRAVCCGCGCCVWVAWVRGCAGLRWRALLHESAARDLRKRERPTRASSATHTHTHARARTNNPPPTHLPPQKKERHHHRWSSTAS